VLRAVHSDRVEQLLAALFEALPPADPFAPATIVVGSHLVQRWLMRELAFSRGIAAGIECVTFDRFVERAWADPTAELSPIDRAQLATLIASVLADAGVVRGTPEVAAYLDAAPDAGDRAGPRRVQLANHLATLCWGYATTRPDWMPAFLGGHVPDELAGDATAAWQAKLVAAAFARLKRAQPTRHHVLAPMLPWARRRLHLPPPTLAPISVFGVSYLQRAQLEALTDLATTTDVTVYALDPCEELWDDVAGRKALAELETTPLADPLPLVLWGKPVRDTLAALVERTSGDVDAAFNSSLGEIDADESALARLLLDVRARRIPVAGEPSAHAGVVIHGCPNPRREIEVIAAEARRRLDADPTLHAHEIAVWLAGDHERYLAQAPAAFEAVGLPCHLVDAPVDDRGRVGEAMLALLELPTSQMARRDLMRVMTHPAVLAGPTMGHVDADDWVRWTERLGIAFGANGESHANTYLEDHPGHFHWDQGVRRLALGAFMVGERGQRGAARIANLDVAPEELRPDQQASAATFALLVRSLCDDAAWLARFTAPLATWAQVLAGLVDVYLAPRDDDARRDIERVRAMLAGLAHLDLDGREVGFREAKEHAARQLTTMRANRGEPLAAGVMIAPLAAMRAVPFRIVFVAGLAEGVFPAGDTPSPLDLRRTPRAGDVSPRDRDRAAFLEVLLCARESLSLSYVAIEPKSGQALGPSSVVLELADALAPYIGASSSREALQKLTVKEPLHRFASGTIAGSQASSGSGAANRSHGASVDGAIVPAAARERWACTVRDAVRAQLRTSEHPIPDEDGVFALLQHPSQAALRAQLGVVDAPPRAAPAVGSTRMLAIANLRDFLEKPVQAWAQAVLGLGETPDDSAAEHSDEPFQLDRPQRAMLLREVFASQLRDVDPAQVANAANAVTIAAEAKANDAKSDDAKSDDAKSSGAMPSNVISLFGSNDEKSAKTNRTAAPAPPPKPSNVIPLYGGTTPIDQLYDAAMEDAQLRGQFPVGVFATSERAKDLAVLETWRKGLGPIPAGAATRFGFGRAMSPGAQLRPPIELALAGGRTVRLTGQTELLIESNGRYTSVITMVRDYQKRTPYHLRGCFDHLVLAATGLANNGHTHKILDDEGKVVVTEHDPWGQDDARAYLTALVTELLDQHHGYLLPFEILALSLVGKKLPSRIYGDPTNGLGYGPIERRDGLALPQNLEDIAKRRLGPLVARMHGDAHGFDGSFR
jgi:exodeoxyribonuclease V gamma subunit